MALTGRKLNGFGAQEVGLIHEVALDEDIETLVEEVVSDLLLASPDAIAETKALLFAVSGQALQESRSLRVDTLNRLRNSSGVEGMAAFKEKRKPNWVPEEAPQVRE